MEQYHEAIWPQLTPIFFYFSKLPFDSDDFELEADQSQLNCYDYLELVIFSTNQTTEICGNSYDQDIGSIYVLGYDWTYLMVCLSQWKAFVLSNGISTDASYSFFGGFSISFEDLDLSHFHSSIKLYGGYPIIKQKFCERVLSRASIYMKTLL